jgi:hypothetical protein
MRFLAGGLEIMSERLTTSGASLEALGRLLAECNSSDCRNEPPIPLGEAKLLREQLELPWPPQQEIDSDAATVVDALMGSATPIGDLVALKDHGKRLAAQRGCQDHYAVGVAICFTAIASAIVHRREKLSTYSPASLARSFRMLMDKDWVTPELRELLAEATRICREMPE